jgi:hypothetical protein
VKLLTEIGSDDFGKNEGRSPKIKKAPKKLLRHLNPTVGGAQQSPPHKTLNQNNCAN